MKPLAALAIEGEIAAVHYALRKLTWMLQDETRYDRADVVRIVEPGYTALEALKAKLIKAGVELDRVQAERDKAVGMLGG